MSDSLSGKRYIAYVRTATFDAGGDNSVDKQLEHIERFARRHKMVERDRKVDNGLGGSGENKSLDQLIKRARDKKDFSFLLVSSPDRLSRSPGAVLCYVHSFRLMGVQIIVAG